jgi:hypothetical protein
MDLHAVEIAMSDGKREGTVVAGSFADYGVLQASCRTTSDEEQHERDKCLRVSDKVDEWWKKDVPKDVQPRCCVMEGARREGDTRHFNTDRSRSPAKSDNCTNRIFGT